MCPFGNVFKYNTYLLEIKQLPFSNVANLSLSIYQYMKELLRYLTPETRNSLTLPCPCLTLSKSIL